MKIGEFAKVCGTRISVLRHYDRLGLLRPVYIDRFTEYRYYDESQTAVFKQIGDLKAAGFSLSEIKTLLYSGDGGEIIAGDDMPTWTRGYVLRKFNSTACAYTIRRIGSRDHLIIEWKSGDYRFGGMDTDYYVFVRDDVK